MHKAIPFKLNYDLVDAVWCKKLDLIIDKTIIKSNHWIQVVIQHVWYLMINYWNKGFVNGRLIDSLLLNRSCCTSKIRYWEDLCSSSYSFGRNWYIFNSTTSNSFVDNFYMNFYISNFHILLKIPYLPLSWKGGSANVDGLCYSCHNPRCWCVEVQDRKPN